MKTKHFKYINMWSREDSGSGQYRVTVRFDQVRACYYLLSAVVAFIISMAVSFTLQKFWTFQNTGHTDMPRQVLLYSAISVCGVCFNTMCIYGLVEFVHCVYIIGGSVLWLLHSVRKFLYLSAFCFSAIFLMETNGIFDRLVHHKHFVQFLMICLFGSYCFSRAIN